MTSGTAKPAAMDLPAPGYPVSEEAVGHWFRQRYQRQPTEQELGAIMGEDGKARGDPAASRSRR